MIPTATGWFAFEWDTLPKAINAARIQALGMHCPYFVYPWALNNKVVWRIRRLLPDEEGYKNAVGRGDVFVDVAGIFGRRRPRPHEHVSVRMAQEHPLRFGHLC